MRHLILTRSAYGPDWDPEANQRRLALAQGITIPSLAAQTAPFDWLVLLHRRDPLLAERKAAFAAAGARFLYTEATGTPQHVAAAAYGASWARAIGRRDQVVAMTRLDDDDAVAPWLAERVAVAAPRVPFRTVLLCPNGIRVWQGLYTSVRHDSNAMQTLVTLPGDRTTVYDYPHRKVRGVARVRVLDHRPAWVWARHPDTISGWREGYRPLTDAVRGWFPIDWSLLEGDARRPRTMIGRYFR